jgi:hypothetical protein
MTDAWGRLHVEVSEDEIIITLPFTNYTVTYYKPATSPRLLAKNFPTKDDSRAPMTQAEFLERAWSVGPNIDLERPRTYCILRSCQRSSQSTRTTTPKHSKTGKAKAAHPRQTSARQRGNVPAS